MSRILVALIRVYQVTTSWLPSPCRFYPSCSVYAVGALQTHGAARGSWLAAGRILRCHPWHLGGVDLVPPARSAAPRPLPGCEA